MELELVERINYTIIAVKSNPHLVSQILSSDSKAKLSSVLQLWHLEKDAFFPETDVRTCTIGLCLQQAV